MGMGIENPVGDDPFYNPAPDDIRFIKDSAWINIRVK
jgi:hypothetical protein